MCPTKKLAVKWHVVISEGQSSVAPDNWIIWETWELFHPKKKPGFSNISEAYGSLLDPPCNYGLKRDDYSKENFVLKVEGASEDAMCLSNPKDRRSKERRSRSREHTLR
ncbi:uncharacterized protein LOC117178751 [Belonocnema kinseyi]|uniref:uncharacterized protein LOC117178751 n=1 Tax=Belonocnema kinseyi TaxID=2817044 RepID=UPI00143DCBB6|nr:uncharacterized protein LOC117178751 [Belonocnema kinseyi]